MPTALIWGGSGGIGTALVNGLVTQGWHVFAGVRNSENLTLKTEKIVEFSASDPHSIQRAMFSVAQECDSLDLVAYIAGSLVYEKMETMSLEDWQSTLDSNLTGAFLATQASLPMLRTGGHLVFVGAYIDHILLPKMGAYAAAKAGLEAYVQVLTREHRRLNISLLRPGAVDTAFWDQVSFKKPSDAKQPSMVADFVIEHVTNNKNGFIDL